MLNVDRVIIKNTPTLGRFQYESQCVEYRAESYSLLRSHPIPYSIPPIPYSAHIPYSVPHLFLTSFAPPFLTPFAHILYSVRPYSLLRSPPISYSVRPLFLTPFAPYSLLRSPLFLTPFAPYSLLRSHPIPYSVYTIFFTPFEPYS